VVPLVGRTLDEFSTKSATQLANLIHVLGTEQKKRNVGVDPDHVLVYSDPAPFSALALPEIFV
jgi:hypothetical protein